MATISQSMFTAITNLTPFLNPNNLLREKIDYDGDNAIYIAWTPIWDAELSDPVWYIKKNIYDGNNLIDSLLPDEGLGFQYSYTDRASHF